MKITLIMPSVGKKKPGSYIKTWQMEPLALAALAGQTSKDIKIAFYDDRLEDIPYDEATNLVGINVETYTARRAYQIAANYRARGIPVILGGFHPTLVPEEAENYADAILIGEAEGIWGKVLEDCKAGQLKKRYKSEARPNLVGAKLNRSIYRNQKYMPLGLIDWGRGCRFNCDFCSITSFYKASHSFRPVKEVVAEIEQIDKKYIFLIDDNIGANPEASKQLLRELIPLKIKWVSQISINAAEDPELLDLMVKSGCQGVLIGFESLNPDNLSLMNKQWNNRVRDYDTALKKFRDRGLLIYGTFVFGYDHDTRASFELTLEFAMRNKLFFAAFNHLVPFPGTGLYRKLDSENRLLDRQWWLNPNYRFGDVVFKPKQMTAEELSATCLEYRQKFYSIASIFKRGLDFKANCRNPVIGAIYFAQNFQAGADVNRRQGLPLGDVQFEQRVVETK